MNTEYSNRLVEKNRVAPIWCPGCGDFGVLQSLVRALQSLGKTPKDTVLVSGIGCSGRLPYFVDAFGFHTLHGRALPIALGVKLASPKLTVVVIGGDGDGFGIGGGHVPHVARRNVDITYLILDNGVYALTKGHSSPTTNMGQKTPSARAGEQVQPLDITGMLLANGTSFVASAWSGDRPQLTEIIIKAIQHSGFSAIRVQSPCPTYNKTVTFDSLRTDIYQIPDTHPTQDRNAALSLHYERGGFVEGVLYRNPDWAAFTGSKGGENNFHGKFIKLVERYA